MNTKLMWKIKQKTKLFRIFIDDKLGNPFIYNYQNILLKLTIVLLIAIFIVIKGCTIPLLIDNKLMRFLFYSADKGDKTLYNISISVIAAYIFYLVQVYIPEKIRCKKQLNIYEVYVGNRHEIFILEQFLKAIDVFLSCKNDKYCFHYKEFKYTTNYGEHCLTKDLYKETLDELTDNIERICKAPKFNEYDSSYQELLSMLFYRLKGCKESLSHMFPQWSSNPYRLSKDEYITLKNRLKDFSRFSKRLQHLSKYSYIVNDEITLYTSNENGTNKMFKSIFNDLDKES